MKVLSIVLGGVVALVLICCGGAIFVGKRIYDKGLEASSGAQAYADESVRAIAASWDASELEKRASTELKAEASHEAIVRLMKQCKARLGALRTVRQHENVLMRSGTTTAAGTFQVVSLNVAATFQKGPGEIKITLVKTGAAWQINEFRVSWPL